MKEYINVYDNSKPLFTHDCDPEHCIFLGNYKKHDLYVHPGVGATYIARYSSDGPDYLAGVVFVGKVEPITEAHRRAEASNVSLPLPYPHNDKNFS